MTCNFDGTTSTTNSTLRINSRRNGSPPDATDELHNDETMEKMAADFPCSYGKLGNRRKCAHGSGKEVV